MGSKPSCEKRQSKRSYRPERRYASASLTLPPASSSVPVADVVMLQEQTFEATVGFGP